MRGRKKKRYSVWLNKTDTLIICDGTADECKKAMGIKDFRSTLCKVRHRGDGKWTIIENTEEDL